MSKLSDFKGQKISVLTSDPSNPVEGQVWYNSTEAKYKISIGYGNGVWSSGGNLTNYRTNFSGGGGTQNEAYAVGGYNILAAEEYNGSSWTAGGNISTNRYNSNMGSRGTQNAGLLVTGQLYSNNAFTTATEEYDGSSWTAGGNVTTANYYGTCAGTQNAAIKAKGSLSAVLTTNKSEIYNGTSWTNIADCVNQGSLAAMTGTQDAALIVGGLIDGSASNVEEYNGSTWSLAQTPLNTRTGNSSFAATTLSEEYNGTSWSAAASITSARTGAGGAGSTASGLVFGGESLNVTSEYNSSPGLATKSITQG
jgi:hypothetical protein